MFKIIDGGKFIEQCVQGYVSPDDIDDFIDNWHEDGDITLELHEYLGMTWDEYESWVCVPDTLDSIITARVQNTL